jgi:hypothetical protein
MVKLRDFFSEAEINAIELRRKQMGGNKNLGIIEIITGQQDVIKELYTEDKNDVYDTISIEELTDNPPPPINWLVDSLFPVGSLNIVGGDGGIGKSWFTLHLALCVATGYPFLNHFETKTGKVTLIDEEDSLALIHDRITRLLSYMNISNKKIPFSLISIKVFKLTMKPVIEATEKLSMYKNLICLLLIA